MTYGVLALWPSMTASASPANAAKPSRVDWRRAEFVLFGVAVLSLVTLLIQVNTISADLPAHPLFVHVPVILIPLSVLGALAVTIKPRWFERYGILLCLCAIVGMSSIFLAENAGGALQHDLHLHGRAAQLINEHSGAANILAIMFAGFTLFLLLGFAAHRIGGDMPTGLAVADRTLSSGSVQVALKIVLVILALVCAFYVYRVGDLGAQAVWQARLQAALHAGHASG